MQERIGVNRIGSFLRRAPKAPLIVLSVVLIGAIFGELIAPYDPEKYDLRNALQPPFWQDEGSLAHVLGTDHMGRDVLSRLIGGARISVIVASVAILLSGSLGVALGLISGYVGGRTDSIIMRVTDITLSLPGILFALILVAVVGPSLSAVILVIAVFGWPSYARISRGQVLTLKRQDFVSLAVVAGCSHVRILLRHILPNVMNTLVVLATLQVGVVIIFEASLSFLGLGIQPPTPSWGVMLSEGREYLSTSWWLATFPGLVIMLTCLSANLVGDWLRDALDPKLRQL